MTIAMERAGVTTFQGRPVTLLGPEVRVGATAPDFTVLADDFSPVTLAASKGTVRIFSVVPSLDTGVCDQQTRRFNDEATRLGGVTIMTVSVDLPFAQKRWCGAASVEATQTVSDYRDLSFGLAYGVVIAEFRLLARAVFVVDSSDQVVHVEYVPEVGQHPHYSAAIEAVRTAM
ncbi:MAG: thiol peroxidase [Actinobacteria bacterium]|nr:thiol peroxidase [Actinomycetota bacterium]